MSLEELSLCNFRSFDLLLGIETIKYWPPAQQLQSKNKWIIMFFPPHFPTPAWTPGHVSAPCLYLQWVSGDADGWFLSSDGCAGAPTSLPPCCRSRLSLAGCSLCGGWRRLAACRRQANIRKLEDTKSMTCLLLNRASVTSFCKLIAWSKLSEFKRGNAWLNNFSH